MWCVNPMVVDTWKAEPYPGYPSRADSAEDEDKVDDHIPSYPPADPDTSLARSSSCNHVNLAVPNRTPRRSLSTSGAQLPRPVVQHRAPTSDNDHPVTDSLNTDPLPKAKDKVKRSNSVLTRLARQYSFTRLRRTSSSSSRDYNMSAAQDQEESTSVLVAKGRAPRRRRNKSASKKAVKARSNGTGEKTPARLDIPKTKGQILPSPLPMTVGNPSVNGELTSSPDSCPSSPPYFKASFSISPPTPPDDGNAARARSPASADESPLPSPPPDDKSYDSGRMSMSSFRSFSSGRPTSMSSVTSSLSSRTSRGSDYFSSASSNGQADQVTSHRLGLQTVLPELDESDSVDRLVLDPDGDDDGVKEPENLSLPQSKETAKRDSRIAAFKQNANLNEVDHLAPVSNLAMLENPDLSYVDRVILELLETERMYVRSLRDILTGYLAVIRRTPQLNIQPYDVDDLFGNIRDVYDFNRNLLGELEDCCGDPRRVAKCFVSKDEDFKVYTEYCTNYPSSVAAMTRCMQNPNLVDFFKVQQHDMRHTLPLGSYLLKPVQRILKYHLLLQELVKNCDKTVDGYETVQNALQTMTRVARHINEMKRKHEDAVHIQEIQSLLTNWQGNELTTYGELILESEMKMQGAKNERQVFLFEKMVLITKRREDGYLVCKTSITCANLVLLESLPNTPLGFQIQPFTENATCISGGGSGPQPAGNGTPDPNRVQRYVLLAPSQEEKSLWTYHIKRLIIETMRAAVPLEAKKSIMRMRPVRDGDGDGDLEEDRMRKKSKSRFGSSAILGNQDGKTTKSPLARLTTSSGNVLSGGGTASKPRRRSDSMSRKGLNKRALQKRKDEAEGGDVGAADSGSSGTKIAGKFSFSSLKQSARSGGAQTSNKPATAQAQTKSSPKIRSTVKTSQNENKNEIKTTPGQNGEAAKRHHNSVIYRRHKRRTSQPITVTEKRLSMKLDDDEGEKESGDDVTNDEEFLNFNPLTARESVSWDIQIVEAVFERYKNEGASPASTPAGETTPTPVLGKRRKSRLVLAPPDSSSEDEDKKMTSGPPSSVIRRRKSKGAASHRTSGVVYSLSQDLEVESDSGLSETRATLRKVAQASESARKSLVIHESDAETEANRILIGKANLLRRGKSPQKGAESVPVRPKSPHESCNRRGSLYDNLDVAASSDVIAANDVITSSVQCMPTQTISVVDSNARSAPEMVTVRSSSVASITSTRSNDVMCANFSSNNNNNNNDKQIILQNVSDPLAAKDAIHIPTGKVRGLIERVWNISRAEPLSPGARRTLVTSHAHTAFSGKFTCEPNSATNTVSSSAVSRSKDSSLQRDRKTTTTAEYCVSAAVNLPAVNARERDRKEKASTTERRVDRLPARGRGGVDTLGNGPTSNPALFVRRTFSQDDSDSVVRRSTSAPGEPAVKTKCGLVKSFSTGERTRDIEKPSTDEGLKFQSTEDNVVDAKRYLFEKLCLGPSDQSKVTDAMSEEFDHVCSDLETGLRVSSFESHAFSATSDEDGAFVTSRLQRTLKGGLQPPVAGKEARKNAVADVSRKDDVFAETNHVIPNPTLSSKSDVAFGPTQNAETVPNLSQNYRRRSGRNSLPNRTDSIRSTRSEFTTPRLSSFHASKDSDARGRSAVQRSGNSFSRPRLPSKDMHAIPQSNVARLAKQFSEISKESEKLAPAPTPRRSRSVGGAAKTRQRLQARQTQEKTKLDEKPAQASSITGSTPLKALDSARRGRSEHPKGGVPRKSHFERASIKVDEMCVCETIDDRSSRLRTAESSPPPARDLGSPIEDDVFSSPPKVHPIPAKKMSLIEMFAANPPTTEPQKKDSQAPSEEENPQRSDSHPVSGDESIKVAIPSVRVVLVPRSDDMEGGGGLEPRVYNLSPPKDASLEKRRSWTKLSSGSEGAPKRTRLRSSSLVRTGRRAKALRESADPEY